MATMYATASAPAKVTPNKERLRLWVRALRSGAYQQGTGVMRKSFSGQAPTWCCLGVAQDLALANGCVSPGVENNWGQSNSLMTDVAKWFGLTDAQVNLKTASYSDKRTAANLNDTAKFTFDQIADAIELTFEL